MKKLNSLFSLKDSILPYLQLLPNDLKQSIMKLLNPVDLCKLAQINREWRTLIDNSPM
jgi:hypothetical protein